MKPLLVAIVLATLTADPVWQVELTTGEILQGELVERTDEHVVLMNAVLGRLVIPADTVKSIHELAPPGQVPAVLDDAIIVEPAKHVKGTWDFTFGLGLNASAGKTDESSLRINFDFVYEDLKQKYTFDSFYVFKSTDNATTDNKFTAGIRGDWPIEGSRWGYFGQGRYDYDQFQSWLHRVTAGGGFTYLLVDIDSITQEDGKMNRQDALMLTANGGLGANKEFGSVDENVLMEGILGLDFTWNVSRRQRLTLDATYYPGITDNQYRFVTRGGWTLSLDMLDGISLTAGYYYEFQSKVDPGVNHNDLQVFITMNVDF